MKVAVLTISTTGAREERPDGSGDAIVEWARRRQYDLTARTTVPDDVNAIVTTLIAWCDSGQADLVLTTGGTGLSPTDVTPEATAAVLERDAPGITELLRAHVLATFPRAALSRGRSGVRARTLIVNLPGSPAGVRDALDALDQIAGHAIAVLRGEVLTHDNAPAR